MAAGRADSDFAGRRIYFGCQIIQWLHQISFDETNVASLNAICGVHRKRTQSAIALVSSGCMDEFLG